MIREINKFTLASHDVAYKKLPKNTRLYFESSFTGTKLAGYIIEKQFEINDSFIIILSQDCMFEGSNNIYLLNKKFKIIGKVGIPEKFSVLPGSYNLQEVKVKDKNTIVLKYEGEIYYEIKINTENHKGFLSRLLKSSLTLKHISSHSS